MTVPVINIQALAALALFIGCLLIARMIANVRNGKWPGGELWILYLRILLGFMFAASITLGIYSFAGIDIISKYI